LGWMKFTCCPADGRNRICLATRQHLPGQPRTGLLNSIGKSRYWLEFNGFRRFLTDSLRIRFGERSAITVCR
jgi:hypothetical protein